MYVKDFQCKNKFSHISGSITMEINLVCMASACWFLYESSISTEYVLISLAIHHSQLSKHRSSLSPILLTLFAFDLLNRKQTKRETYIYHQIVFKWNSRWFVFSYTPKCKCIPTDVCRLFVIISVFWLTIALHLYTLNYSLHITWCVFNSL